LSRRALGKTEKCSDLSYRSISGCHVEDEWRERVSRLQHVAQGRNDVVLNLRGSGMEQFRKPTFPAISYIASYL
jgi:hypothetical protein